MAKSFGPRFVALVVPHRFKNLTAMQLATGIAYSTLHKWKTGEADPKLPQLEKVARAVGVDLLDLLRGAANDSGLDRACDRPSWAASVEKAKAKYRGKLPEYSYDYAGLTAGAHMPEEIDEHFVYDLAEFWFKHATSAELIAGERERVRAEMAAAERGDAPGPDTGADEGELALPKVPRERRRR